MQTSEWYIWNRLGNSIKRENKTGKFAVSANLPPISKTDVHTLGVIDFKGWIKL